ncbi:hypothetical protein DFQ26_006447 [Actinomortierella ambigua]|nr:hypothetical protein DFQ26_006447 [Actinomortierella ambigua]
MKFRIIAIAPSTISDSTSLAGNGVQERQERPVLYVSREQSIKNRLRACTLELRAEHGSAIAYATTKIYSKQSQSFQSDDRFPDSLAFSPDGDANGALTWDVVANSALWRELQRLGAKDIVLPFEMKAQLVSKVQVASTIVLSTSSAVPTALQQDPTRMAHLVAGRHVSVGDRLQYPPLNPQLVFQVVGVRSSTGGELPIATIAESTNIELAPFLSAAKGSRSSDASQLINPMDWIAAVKRDIGGYTTTLQEIIDYMYMYLEEAVGRKKTMSCSETPFKGIVITGRPGTGKTALATTLARTSGLPYRLVNCPDLFQTDEGESEGQLCSLFQALQSSSKASFLILDEIDMLAERSAVKKGVEAKLFATLLNQIDALNQSPDTNKVFVIALTNRPHVMDTSLTRSGRLDRIFALNIGSSSERFEVLDIISRQIPFELQDRCKILERVANVTHGFVPTDLQALCTEAALILVSRVARGERNARIDLSSFTHALKSIRPSGMGEFQTKIPDVHFSDLYGLEGAIADLRVSIIEPFQHPRKYLDLGIAPPRGVLIHGPPGVGKTMLCCALAQELGINFMLVEGSQIRSKVVGESEQNIARMFAQAKANAPCILFIDQIDVLAPARGSTFSSENSGDRIVTSLLTEMDGFFTGRGGSNVVVDVLVLAGKGDAYTGLECQYDLWFPASNRPEVIDSAIMRPGRLDQIVHVPVPDKDVRIQILRGFLSKMPIGLEEAQIVALATETEGFSGADLENLCREAALVCLRENIHNGLVEWAHFQAAKQLIPPSLVHYKSDSATFRPKQD